MEAEPSTESNPSGFESLRAQIKTRRKAGFDIKLARPERFELPTTWFVARYSIQLSYGRVFVILNQSSNHPWRAFQPGHPVRSLAEAKLCFASRLAQLSYGR